MIRKYMRTAMGKSTLASYGPPYCPSYITKCQAGPTRLGVYTHGDKSATEALNSARK